VESPPRIEIVNVTTYAIPQTHTDVAVGTNSNQVVEPRLMAQLIEQVQILSSDHRRDGPARLSGCPKNIRVDAIQKLLQTNRERQPRLPNDVPGGTTRNDVHGWIGRGDINGTFSSRKPTKFDPGGLDV
jgi:hypothetical protein